MSPVTFEVTTIQVNLFPFALRHSGDIVGQGYDVAINLAKFEHKHSICSAGSGAVTENLCLATILLILTASVVDACWYFYKHPIRLRLTSSSLVASGLFFQKEYPLTCIVGFYVPPYCGSGYFEISHMLDGTGDSMKVFDAAGRDVFRRALGERAPWVKCLGA